LDLVEVVGVVDGCFVEVVITKGLGSYGLVPVVISGSSVAWSSWGACIRDGHSAVGDIFYNPEPWILSVMLVEICSQLQFPLTK
jgi:hypothetical protein